MRHCLAGNKQLGVDGVQVPLEGLTLELVPQLHSLGNIPKVSLVVANALVIIFGIIVQPNLGQPNRIPFQHINTRSPLWKCSQTHSISQFDHITTQWSILPYTAIVSGKCVPRGSRELFPGYHHTSTFWTTAPSSRHPKYRIRNRINRAFRRTPCQWQTNHRPLWASALPLRDSANKSIHIVSTSFWLTRQWIRTLWRFFSRSGTACQLNCRFQSKPPTLTPVESRKKNSSVSSLITSITGQTTFVGSLAILSSSGSNQPSTGYNNEDKLQSALIPHLTKALP